MTQDDLSDATGISKFSIVAYEAGRSEPSTGKLAAMADALDASTDYLLGRVNHASGLNCGDFVLDEEELLAIVQSDDADELEGFVERSMRYMAQIPASPMVLNKREAERHRREVERHVQEVAPGLLDD